KAPRSTSYGAGRSTYAGAGSSPGSDNGAMKRKANDLSALEERLGYRFRKIALLEQALTHKSFVTGRKHASNQRLEFLGDRVLGLAVAEMLYEFFPGNLEGELSQRHTALVRNETCV